MKYTEAQIETLKQLRKILLEHGFETYSIVRRYAKHPLEFVAIEKSHDPNTVVKDRHSYSSAIVRLFLGKVRIQFLEVGKAWSGDLLHRVVHGSRANRPRASVIFHRTHRNHSGLRFRYRYWHEFVYQKELKKTRLAGVIQQLKNAGIILKKGTDTLT